MDTLEYPDFRLEHALRIVKVRDVVARREARRVVGLAVELRDGLGALLSRLVVPRGRVGRGCRGCDGGGERRAARHARQCHGRQRCDLHAGREREARGHGYGRPYRRIEDVGSAYSRRSRRSGS